MDDQRRLEHLALVSLTGAECPDADILAAHILGTLTGTQQLVVAAHVRTCPLCRHDLASARPPEPRPRTVLARLLPLAVLEGRRSSGHAPYVRQYIAADLRIDLTVAPPVGEHWRITGQVLRTGAGLADCIVILRAGRHRYQQTSDPQGFFTFSRVPAGRYTLTVADGQMQVQIRALILSPDLPI